MITANLDGKRVFVTGGTSGIGLACVRTFASMGAVVVANHLPDDTQATSVISALSRDGYAVSGIAGSVAEPE